MASIRDYIRNNLLDPLKYYPTVIQETLIELITEKLESLYNYTILFPEIVSPNTTRLDILKNIASQFLFTIRDEADLQEQINILDNILYVYNRRGSIDTIENMWKYYGGDLPREVKVIIPSYNLFRYNMSAFSDTNVFQDGDTNHTGLYEIRLTNNTYPIPKLKEFLLKELVAAGNYIYFTNAISLDVRGDITDTVYKYLVDEDTFLNLQLSIAKSYTGLTFSGASSVPLSGSISPNNLLIRSVERLPKLDSLWSGRENIFKDIHLMTDIRTIFHSIAGIKESLVELDTTVLIDDNYKYIYNSLLYNALFIDSLVYCTPSENTLSILRDLYNDKGEHVEENEYFILGESLLNESLGYGLVEGDN